MVQCGARPICEVTANSIFAIFSASLAILRSPTASQLESLGRRRTGWIEFSFGVVQGIPQRLHHLLYVRVVKLIGPAVGEISNLPNCHQGALDAALGQFDEFR